MPPKKPKVKTVKRQTCLAEAQRFCEAFQKIKASGKLDDLIDAFEREEKQKFRQILDGIPGIAVEMKDTMDKHAHKNTTVAFNWF